MADYQDFKMDGKTLDITKENIAAMKQLFPEIVTDGKVDFEKLRLILGDEVETSDERYNFTWHGKNQAIRLSQTPSMGTLRPCKEDSVNWDTTKNLYIEGDNLEVLKLLQRSYFGRIKMIYIDPPYNTGKDFVYPDDYQDGLKNYLKLTNQYDEDGKLNTTNPESDGKFHTNWLNLMYPRLRLARNLLSEDGVICISIDDHEVASLKLICSEIFGENNFEGHIHWRRRHNQPNDKTKMIGIVTEHILVYSKNSSYLKSVGVGKLDLTATFTNPDSDPRGPWASKPWKTGSDQSGSRYRIVSPTGKIFDEEWMGEESTYLQFLNEGRIYFPKNGDGLPRKKYYQFEREEEGQCASNWWPSEIFGSNQSANDELTTLFGVKNVFSNPKPVELMKNLLKIANVKANDIVLDFFSGSATIAQAVFELNKEDAGHRSFICIQIPEVLSSNSEAYTNFGFKTICDIGKERIRRVSLEIKKSSVQTTLDNSNKQMDLGFRTFKLDSSNIRKWSPGLDLRNSLLSFENNLISDPSRNDMDIVFEILLKLGLDLNSNVEEKQNYYSVENGTLMICLKDVASVDIAQAMIDEFKEKEPLVWKVVFKDNGFASDDVKANTRETLKMAGLQKGSFITL